MARKSATIRRHLDRRLSQLPGAREFTRPPDGWIRSIRQALGMSAAELGDRMRISKARVLAIEKGEARGTLNLETIHRAAEALDCTLVYALIPRKSLDQTVRQRALEVAAEHLSAVDQTMRLEDQGVTPETSQRQLHEVADQLMQRSPRSLWKRRATR